jgi:hypothetical protein
VELESEIAASRNAFRSRIRAIVQIFIEPASSPKSPRDQNPPTLNAAYMFLHKRREGPQRDPEQSPGGAAYCSLGRRPGNGQCTTNAEGVIRSKAPKLKV